MKDLNLSRVINVVAVTGLSITVVGCGGDRGLARKYCKAQEKCDKAAFEEEYSSMQDCVDTGVEEIDDLEKADEGCADAVREFVRCSAKAYRKSCDEDDIYDECEDEAEDFVDECADVSLGEEYDYDY